MTSARRTAPWRVGVEPPAYLVAAGAALLLLALSTRYGPHRDELHFVAGATARRGPPRPAAPSSPAPRMPSRTGSLLVLRLVPALVIGVVTALQP